MHVVAVNEKSVEVKRWYLMFFKTKSIKLQYYDFATESWTIHSTNILYRVFQVFSHMGFKNYVKKKLDNSCNLKKK